MTSPEARASEDSPKRASAPKASGRVTPKASGRVTPKASAPSGRYTPPIPKEQKVSPPWYPWVLLSFFVLGLAVIVVNYAQIFWTATNWALVGGIAAILVGVVMATRYR
jgi:Cell division protein CrgA